MRGKYIRTPEIKKKNSLSNIGKNLGNPRPKNAYSFPKGNKIWKNRDQDKCTELSKQVMSTPEYKLKASIAAKKVWQDSEYREKMKKIFSTRPKPTKESNLKRSATLKGRPSYTKGMTFSDEVNKTKGRFGNENAMSRPEVKAKQKLACRTYGAQWKGGISYEPYNSDFDLDFKKKIKTRDCFSCMKCDTEESLCIHHIDYDKSKSTDENCCTLCLTCNSEVNWGREQWTGFFQNELNECYGYKYE